VRLARTPDGRRLEVDRVVAAPRERVWDLLRDTDRWPAWGPSVRAVESPDRYAERGTRGRIRPPVGPWLPFEVTACRDHRWTWSVARVPATGHRVERATGGSRVVFEIPLGGAVYAPVCRRALRRIEELASDTARDR
jgi:uncharacterized protein YndB with AHSA1/START domain